MTRESRMPNLLIFQHRIVTLLVLAVISLALPFAMAQQSTAQQSAPGQQPASPGQKPNDQKSDDSQGPTETLKVNVNVVKLFFKLKSKHGSLIPNLTKDNLEVHEVDPPKPIKYSTAETNLPLTLG